MKNLNDILPNDILDKVIQIHIPVNNIDDRKAWRFSPLRLFVKTATWANNTSVRPHPKAKFINSIWKFNLRPEVQLFAWKLVGEIPSTRGKLRHFGVNISFLYRAYFYEL